MPRKSIPKHHQKRFEAISTYLRELRFSEGMTQHELSQHLNLHRNTIQNIENQCNATLLSIFELADAFDISVSQLFQEVE